MKEIKKDLPGLSGDDVKAIISGGTTLGLAIARISAGDVTAVIPIGMQLWNLGKGVYNKYKQYKANKAKRLAVEGGEADGGAA